jgi:hexulose-6-phosphate isomerase
LKELGFSGWATAEIPGGNRDRLKNIAERMDRIFAS